MAPRVEESSIHFRCSIDPMEEKWQRLDMRFFLISLLLVLTACTIPPAAVQLGAPFAGLGKGGDGYVRPALKEACDYTDVVLGSGAYEREVALCERWTDMYHNDALRYQYSDFTQALYGGDCEAVRQSLAQDFSALMEDAVFTAGRLRKGLCIEQDPKKAFALLEAAVKDAPYDPLILAHLGDMLWKGEGTLKDRPRARALLERAANAALPGYIDASFRALHRPPRYPHEEWSGIPVKAGFWGHSNVHLAANFAHPILGPWILPEPLYDVRLRMEDIVYAGGHALVEKANALLSSSSERDRTAAIDLLSAASASRLAPASIKMADVLTGIGPEGLPAAWGFLAKNPQCEAIYFLEGAALDGSYRAFLYFLEAARAKAESSLSPAVYQQIMTDAALSSYQLYDIAGQEWRSMISSMHGLVAEMLAYGYPLPPVFAPVADRIISEAANPMGMLPAWPSLHVKSFIERTC